MRKTLVFLAIIVGLAVSATGPASADSRWAIDPAHANIYFEIDHIYSKIRGSFQKFDGDITFDPDNPAIAKFKFSVAVDSINTNDTRRDDHLLSADFFDARNHPEMTFESTAVRHTGGGSYELEGTLAVKDVRRTVTIPLTFLGAKPDPFNKSREVGGFEVRMTLDRLAYHVGSGKLYKMGVVGKDVTVLISVEARRET